ncbi:hypothetical protein DACRYDRAFT_25631 [Dacryopinax primogenitus]|uniref:Uncharacterized protein n=1 Tax=Dacryopinax primogenitus (strain DJM 731) TaxID=1858805 RepID=M5FYE2_DACPD|nr:uncharacterized protein DACRYDRAFT_25631 [Dacryopinax primogenitus]EJT96542.1 hypothetical protein DACRYDRAFT_25631 [Dacryopinax primogenitus]
MAAYARAIGRADNLSVTRSGSISGRSQDGATARPETPREEKEKEKHESTDAESPQTVMLEASVASETKDKKDVL